jgi:cysteine desulfurase/selenocysteine lyase
MIETRNMASTAASKPALALDAIRAEFPILRQDIHGYPLAYLDTAASAQKPRAVIEATSRFYERDYANVHRGVHTLSQRATDLFEATREKVRRVLNAGSLEEIVYTKGCTEGINLVAQSYARPRLKKGDEVLVTHMEHHSNLVPWQILCEQTGATLRAMPMNNVGELELGELDVLVSERTKVAAFVHVSNSIGTINPIRQMIRTVRQRSEAICVVDGAQAGPHLPIDVRDLDVDFYTLSCHKMYAPTGVGILYGRSDRLAETPPYQAGGGMIREVQIERTTYADPPERFEPGTPNIAGFVGYGAALDFVASLGGGGADWERKHWVAAMERIGAHEQDLLSLGTRLLQGIPGVRIIGLAKEKAGILSFEVDGVHPHDVGQVLDSLGVAVRVGHHCTQPVMRHFGVSATTRASFGFYTTPDEVERLAEGIKKAKEAFA